MGGLGRNIAFQSVDPKMISSYTTPSKDRVFKSIEKIQGDLSASINEKKFVSLNTGENI